MRSLSFTYSLSRFKNCTQLAKTAAIIPLLLIFASSSFAQQIAFMIKGKVSGPDSLKYAYVFDHQRKFIKRDSIANGEFKLKGECIYVSKFNEPPHVKVFLSNYATDTTNAQFPENRNFSCAIMIPDTVEVSYNSATRVFQIKGGKLNEVQNSFLAIEGELAHQRDSINTSIDERNLTEAAKKKQRFIENRTPHNIAAKKKAKLIARYTDSEVTLFHFSNIMYNPEFSGEELLSLYGKLSPRLKKSFYGGHIYKGVLEEIKSRVVPTQTYTVGKVIPGFELENAAGNLTKSQSKLGKYTLIDFWATWCGPCRLETPNLISSYVRFKDKGFRVITVSIDEKNNRSNWITAIDMDKMQSFTNLLNDFSKSTIVKELQINAIPANYLVDSTGKIVALNLRGEELVKTLNKLLE